jgi:hypothetical protein
MAEVTSFLQVFDNAKTLAVLSTLANTTSPLTISGLDTRKFQEVTSGYIVTIWDSVLYPDPGDDPNMEKVLVTDAIIAANGTFTMNRPNPKVHTGTPAIQVLNIAQHLDDVHAAINNMETGLVVAGIRLFNPYTGEIVRLTLGPQNQVMTDLETDISFPLGFGLGLAIIT